MSATSTSVKAFLDGIDHPRRAEIDALRQTIAAAEPVLVERIKWNGPSFALGDDDRITFRLAPGPRIELIFHRGAKVKDTTGFAFTDPTGLLDFRAPDRALLVIADKNTISEVALTGLVRAWLAA